MTQIITVLILMIVTGTFIYTTKYKKEGKPKIGFRREKTADYFKDYLNLKLYWASIVFIVFGISILVVILIIELVFS